MAAKFLPHLERLEAVAASASGLLALGGLRDIASGAVAPTSVHLAALPKLDSPTSLEVGEAVYALAFAGEQLCAGDATGAIHVWDTANGVGKSLGSKSLHKGAVRALFAVGTTLYSAGEDGVFLSSEVGAKGLGKPTTLAESERAFRAIAVDEASDALAVAGDDGMIRHLRGDAVHTIDVGMAVTSLAYLGDGRIAAGCADGSLRLAFLEGEAEVFERSKEAAHDAAIRALIYPPQLLDAAQRPLPRKLLSVSVDGTIKAWQVDTKRKPKTTKVSSQALTAALHIPGGARAKGDKRGGTLYVADRGRILSLLTVAEDGALGDGTSIVQSRFEELGGLVRSRKDETRISAVSEIGKLVEDEARRTLDDVLLTDNKPAVRRAAASAISSSDRRLSRPALRRALSDSDPKVRDSSLRALEHIERDAPVAAARAALASNKGDMRIAALRKLPGLRAQSSLVPGLIAQTLSDGNDKVRAAALDALYKLDPESPLDAARTALTRGPADIRQAVLVRIGRGRLALHPEGEEILEGALDDEHEVVRTTAFLTSIAARPSLMVRVRAVDPHTKKAVADLESHGLFADAAEAGECTEDDLRPLFAAMACRFADTAMRAARLLGMLGDPRATGALLQLSREAEPSTRRYVIEALMSSSLAMPADARLTARLRWLIDDGDETVRQAAFNAVHLLAEMQGAPAEIDVAALALQGAHSDVRVQALAILVKFGGSGKFAQISSLSERADELLGDALDDEDDTVRGEAFRTLWAWHSKDARRVLERGAACRQAEVRRRVVAELPRQKPAKNAWADALLLTLVSDYAADVGRDAFEALKSAKGGKKRADVYLAALRSPSAEVRALGLREAPASVSEELAEVVAELVRDRDPSVHLPAIEALDRLAPKHAEGFAIALGSEFHELRVRAMELCGRRRDERCAKPALDLLAIEEGHVNRPSDERRQRAASALADLGAPSLQTAYRELLLDRHPGVREMASRGLATSARPGDEAQLITALGHEDLAVRSWIAEGLARLGDVRARPVLAGTLAHDHVPLRQGAIFGFVALGPDGTSGLLQGLDDRKREIQDLAFAVIVARDLALASAGEAPDLLLSALCAEHPEIRFAAARLLEVRGSESHREAAAALVGPAPRERASEMSEWPSPEEREQRIAAIVDALASDHPAHRYAATQVLALRAQPMAFWRESKALLGPSSLSRPRIPFTSWDKETKEPRKRSWIHRLVRSAQVASASSETERIMEMVGVLPTSSSESELEAVKLVFGTYAGLVRGAPVDGDSDTHHRVRRDSVGRLAALASEPSIGTSAVMPVLRSALSDPHHMVRRAAVSAVRSLYPADSLEPLRLELRSTAGDVGRGGVTEVVARAQERADALELAKETINAPAAEVRRFGLSQLPQLFESGSLEPWLLALESRYSDIRINVVDRLVDSTDERVTLALGRAMESEHEDLRLRAASALASRGDIRTADVLGALLYSEEWEFDASCALLELAHARNNPEAKAAAANAIIARLENDADETADRDDLLSSLRNIGHSSAAAFLTRAILDEESRDSSAEAFSILAHCLQDHSATPVRDGAGDLVPQFDDVALGYVREVASSKDATIRERCIREILRYLPGRDAEELVEGLVQDRAPEVRIEACKALAYRAENREEASVGALQSALREGRRELVLPSAEGLAVRQKREAFQPLLLVFKAGEQSERMRAVMAMGALGDVRFLDELLPLVENASELEPEDAELVPAIVESLGRMLPRLKNGVATKVRGLVENLALEGSDELRERALCGLRRAGDARCRAFIERIAADTLEGRNIRVAAIRQLQLLADPESEPVLSDIIREGNYVMGYMALEALATIFPDEKTRTQLIAITSPDHSLSAPAANFLSWFGEIETLMEQLSSVTDRGIRSRLRQGLMRREVAAPRALEAQLRRMLSSAALLDRADAAWIIGAGAFTGLASDLRDSLVATSEEFGALRDQKREHAEEAWTAGLWAATLVGADAKAPAWAALDDTSLPSKLRVMAARVASDGDAVREKLEALLLDRDAGVRATAASALAAKFPKVAQETLAKAAITDSASLRPVVVAASEAGADLLEHAQTRRIATSTMMGRGRIEDFVKTASSGKDTKARLAAIAALGRMGGDQAEGALTGLLKHEKEADEVKAASFRALRRLQRRAAKLASYEDSP